MKALLLFAATALAGAFAQAQHIAIDSGHTLEHPGSNGTCGTPEVWVNDAISLRLADVLTKRGFRVTFTRKPNTDRSKILPRDGRENPSGLAERAMRANASGANLFVSIHHDSVADEVLESKKDACPGQDIADPKGISEAFLANPDVQIGFNTFYMREPGKETKTARSRRLANLIGDEFLKLGDKPSTYHIPKYEPSCGSCRIEDRARGVMSRTLGVLRGTRMPSVLVEITNLRVPEMEKKANDPAYQQSVAEGLADAIANYFQQGEKR